MPFTRPTLAELITRIRADFRSRLAISGSLLRRAMADVLAVVWSGAVHMLHGHLDWLALQLFATTAERAALLVIGSVYELPLTAATFASGTMTATGVNTTDIPSGTIYVRDDAATFISTALVTIAGGTAIVPVDAVLAGIAGNTPFGPGGTMDLESPIAGVDTLATVDAAGIIGGNDEETTEQYRTRLLLHLRRPPQGGANQDYEAWALAVVGVTRVWVYEHEGGLGTATIRFVRDAESPIIPDAGEVTAVQTAIDAERPITTDVTVAAPTDAPTAFTISITPDTAANRLAVEAELADLMTRDAEPGDGVSRGTIYLSAIQTAVGVAKDVTDYTVTVPAADVVPALGALPTAGVVTWV